MVHNAATIREIYNFFARPPFKNAEYFIQSLYGIFVKNGDAVIDCGANWGTHAYLLAHLVGKSGKVFAFEALPELAQNLKNYGDPLIVFHGCLVSPEIASIG